AVAETSDDFFLALHDDIQQAIDEFQLYSQKLDELCGSESPPSSSILGALTACRDVVQSVAKEVLARQSEAAQATEEAADQAAAADDQGQPAARTAATVAVGVGEIRNREDALKALGDIAEFFRRNEPHTPVTYLL